jgi:N utilization substance protein A
VGLRGQRVKNIVRELNNEKVDIIPWSADVRSYVTAALSPAKLKNFEVDEANKRVKIVVSPDQLSLAIGRRGQNARLTSKLTGWYVDIEEEVQAPVQGFQEKVEEAIQTLAGIPGLTETQASALVHMGFHAFEDLAQAEVDDLQSNPDIGDQAVAILAAVQAEAVRRSGSNGEGAAGV